MATMEKQLVSQEEEHQAALHRLEIDVLMEKERLESPTVLNVLLRIFYCIQSRRERCELRSC